MKRLISLLLKNHGRWIVRLVLIGMSLLVLNAFSCDKALAIVERLPPDANYYQLRRTAANEKGFSNQTPSDNYLDNAQNSYQNTAEKIAGGNLKKLLPNSKNYLHLDETHTKNNPEVVNGMPPQDREEG